MAGLAKIAGQTRHDVALSRAGLVDAIASSDGGTTTLWLANLTAAPQTIELPSLRSGEASVAILAAETFERMTTEADFLDKAAGKFSGKVLTLEPYAVARIVVRG